MLAGLAAQTITIGPGPTAAALGTSAAVFVSLLVASAVFVSTATAGALKPVRMVGPAVRRWSGYVMLAVGLWLLALVLLPRPPLIG